MQGLAKFAVVVGGLVLVGWIAWWLLKALLGIFFYLLLGALVVGGVMMIAKFTGRGLGSGARRRLPKN